MDKLDAIFEKLEALESKIDRIEGLLGNYVKETGNDLAKVNQRINQHVRDSHSNGSSPP